MHRCLVPIVLIAVLLPATSSGQSAPAPTVEVDPLRCWWRTSTGAVRIGEIFSVVLTCAVLQNRAVQVVPDESRLNASVVQMAPFEVVGGTHPADVYGPNRRFFQYEYRLRIISPDVIGGDLRIPDLQIHYRIHSTVAANTALQGRDHMYLLPPQSIRVLSLVPADAGDIRDGLRDGLGALERLSFRAQTLDILAFTAIALGGLIACAGVAHLLFRTRKQAPVAPRGLTDAAMLRLAFRELTAVQQAVKVEDWNDELVARALAASRVTAACALGRRIHQQRGGGEPAEGQLSVRSWPRRTATLISGAATAGDLSHALDTLPMTAATGRRQVLEDLRSALTTLTAARYAREARLEPGALDTAVAQAIAAARQLTSAHTWPAAHFRRSIPRVQAQEQA